MKKKLSLLVAIFAMALGLGAAVGVGINDNKEVKSAHAISAGDTMYFGARAWYGSEGAIWVHCSGGASVHDIKMTQLGDSNMYSFVLPDCTKLTFSRGDDSGIRWDWGNQSNDYLLSSLDGGNNYVEPNENWWTGFDVGGEGHKGEYRPAIDSGKTYLRGSWSGGWADFSKEMTLESENVYKIENVLLSAGNEIKVMQINSGHWAEYKNASSVDGNAGASFENNNVQITVTGNYTVRFNASTYKYTVDEYEDTDLTAAIDFADDFETQMGKYCPVAGSEEGRLQKDFTDAWDAFNTRFTTTETSGTRNYLKTLNEKTLNEFRERYESIMGDYYGLLSSYNFLEFTPSSEKPFNSIVSASESMNGMSIVIIASTVAMISVAGYFLVRRARKED